MISKKDSIFIAGHTGMVGSSIKRALIKKGYSNLLCPNKKELNLLNFENVNTWFKKNKPDIVILAAAKVGGISANSEYPGDFLLENLKIQTNVIENAWKNEVKRFLFLGSSCIYPKYSSQPINENELLTGALELTNEPYAIAKIAGIKLCSSLHRQYGFNAISLMPTNLYGPCDNYHPDNSHVLPSLIRKFYEAKIKNEPQVICWGSGSPKREFLYVDDLAEASIFFLENISIKNKLLYDKNKQFSGIINVGIGEEVSIEQLANLISSEIGYCGQINWDKSKPDGTPRKLLDITKAKELGWTARVPLRKGINLTIKKYQEELINNSLRS